MPPQPSQKRRKPAPTTHNGNVEDRLKSLPWVRLEETLNAQGWASTTAVLSPEECRGLIALYAQDDLYRKRHLRRIFLQWKLRQLLTLLRQSMHYQKPRRLGVVVGDREVSGLDGNSPLGALAHAFSLVWA